MKNKIISSFLIIFVLSLAILPSYQVQAKVQDFSDIYMELTLPDNTVMLTEDTPDTDENWITAGISDVKTEKKNMDKMGVKALLYDPDSKSLVRLLEKQSSQTSDIFNLSLLSDQKRKDFLDGLVKTDDANTKATVEVVPHEEAIFFRYNIEITKDGTTMSELIYGTIVNGYTISYDIYQSTKTVPIDETFVKGLVAGTHFTKFLDKSEVEQQMKNSIIRLLIEFAVLVAVIVLWIIVRKKKNKNQKTVKDYKADALTKFYTAKKLREEQNIKETILFTNHTKYTEEVIKDFCYYNRFLKKIKIWVLAAILFVFVLFVLYTSSTGLLGCIIAIILLFIFVYYQGISVEKLVTRMMKTYDKKKGMDAVFTFYEDYFSLSGIQYISNYPYLQVTEVKQYKDFIYIYLGQEKALYLKKDGFVEDTDAFLKFMDGVIKSK